MTDTTTAPRLLGASEYLPLAVHAYRRFADQVTALSPEDWSKPTDCTGWDVRALVGHLVGAQRSAATIRELLSQQLTITRRMRKEGGPNVDVMTDEQIRRTAGLTTEELTAECVALIEPAAKGRAKTPRLMRWGVRFPVEVGGATEKWTLAYLVDTILTRDAWLHTVDLTRAVGRDLPLDPATDGRIVEDVVAEWARRHGQPFDLVLTGPAGGHYASGHAGAERHELDAVEFCRILSGRAKGTGLLTTDVPF